MTTASTTMNETDLTPVEPLIKTIRLLEEDLNRIVLEREDVVRMLMISVLARQHMWIVGAPGAAKSLIISRFASYITNPTATYRLFFDALCSRQTKIDEIFGPPKISAYRDDRYERAIDQYLPNAVFAFLDEFGNASSTLQHATLKVLNEREYQNGSITIRCPLNTAMVASNVLPQGEDVAASWDRFLIRQEVKYVSRTNFARMLDLPDELPPPPATLSLTELHALQNAIKTIPIPAVIRETIDTIRNELESQKGIVASDRRWRQTKSVLRASAALEGRGSVGEDDLDVLNHILWQRPDQRTEVARLVAQLANPLFGQATEIGDQAADVFQGFETVQKSNASPSEKMGVAVEANSKIGEHRKKLKAMLKKANAEGRSTKRLIRIDEQIAAAQRTILEIVAPGM